ncbi:MAG: tetratricopeptide repeat protein [Bacteroidota bacterium]
MIKMKFAFGFLYLAVLIWGFTPIRSFSQQLDSLIYENSKKITFETERSNLLANQIRELDLKIAQTLTNDQTIGTTANNIINWSGWIMTSLVFVIGAGAWFAGNKFNEIEKIRRELTKQLEETRKKASEEIEAISHLKNELESQIVQFQEEREKAIKLMFPLLEGQWYYYQGDAIAAIQAYQEAYRIDPNQSQVYGRLGKLYMEQGDFQKAVKLLNNRLDKFPMDFWLYTRLGQAYRRAGDYNRAKASFRTVLDQQNTFWHAWYGLGRVEMVLKNFSDAEQYLQRAILHYKEQEEDEPSWMYINLALVQNRLGNSEQSEINRRISYNIHKERIKKAPKNPKNYAIVGLYYLMEKEWRKALTTFKKFEEVGFPKDLGRSYGIRVDLAVGDLENKSIKEIKSILQNQSSI